ncbi:hypothetical protein FS837_005613 [Tulasnella sp. UAMH 9824]|nr:hypothetical protein FS837_005613 [Tulasnella sp. UAMH 9824]
MAQIQEGRGSSLSDLASKLSLDKTSSGSSEKPKACDAYGSGGEDLEIGRNQKPEPDTKPPWTPTLNVPSDDETYLDSSEDSPYPEVRASVSNIDDVEMPCLTFRVWVIGFLISTAGSAANIVFNFRYPSPYISPIMTLYVTMYWAETAPDSAT